MKISVKQGRLMAVMAAMILIIGIFVVGKMLGYGSANNRYLLEGYKEGMEGDAGADAAGEEEEGASVTSDVDDEVEMGGFTDGKKKGKKEFHANYTDIEKKEEKKEKEDKNKDGEEPFTCGSKIANYDDQEGVYAAF